MNKQRNEALQALCRDYLRKLRYVANKHGLLSWVERTIKANERKQCEATNKECEMLARIVNEERISRQDIPKELGKSYAQCENDGTFDKIKKVGRIGIYSKLSVLLLKAKKTKDDDKKRCL